MPERSRSQRPSSPRRASSLAASALAVVALLVFALALAHFTGLPPFPTPSTPQAPTARLPAQRHQPATNPPHAQPSISSKRLELAPAGPHRYPSGRILWEGGQPAQNALVHLFLPQRDPIEAWTSTDGTYHLREAVPLEDLLDPRISIHPRCWHAPTEAVATVPEVPEEGTAFILDTIVLPCEFDLALDIDVQPRLLRLLKDRGFSTSARVSITEYNPRKNPFLWNRLRDLSVTLDANPHSDIVRLPFYPQITVALSFKHASGRTSHVDTRNVAIDRTGVPRVAFRLGIEHILVGTVVDHEGRPLPQASVSIRRFLPGASPAGTPYAKQLAPDATFTHFAVRAEVFNVEAVYRGGGGRPGGGAHLKKVVEGVTVGDTNFQIALDMRDHQQLVLRRGARMIDRFRVVVNLPLQFAKDVLQPLPFHPGGVAWIPKHWTMTGGTTPEWFLIAWEENGNHHEELFRAPKPDLDGRLVIDLLDYDVHPLGTLEIVMGALEGNASLGIERIDPAAAPNGAGKFWDMLGYQSRVVHGIPRGRYRIDVWEKGKSLMDPDASLARLHFDFRGGTKRLDIPAMMDSQ